MRMWMREMLLGAVAVIGLGSAAHADTISIGSYAGSTQSTTFANSGTAYDATNSGTSGAGTGTGSFAYSNGAYASPLSGTTFLSFNSNGGGGAGYTTYTTTFTLGSTMNYSGVLSYMADNSVNISLNGTQIVSNGGGFSSASTVALTSTLLQSGTNTLVFTVYNADNNGNNSASANPTAFDYQANLTGTAITPEPRSAVLLGTGLLGTGGLYWRRREREKEDA